MKSNKSRTVKIKKSLIISTKKIISEIEKIKREKFNISTGSKKIDDVIGGGFHSNKTYIIFGANKTGKTQLCHQLSVQAYHKSFKLIYLDTENTFRPERIRVLAKTQELESEKILKNILVSKILSNPAFLLKLNEIEDIIKQNNIKILIIDSINNYYRFELSDKEVSSFRAKTRFLKILEKINNLTRKYNLITILTAQVAPNFIENSIIRELPVGLRYLNHYFSEVLYLNRKESGASYLHLINSHQFPEKKTRYMITNNGIEEYKI
jgi:DNA repair protein RadA